MDTQTAARVERFVDVGAAALFAAAVGYAIFEAGEMPRLSTAASALGFFGCFHILRRIEPEDRAFVLRDFHCAAIEAVEQEELLLTDADRLSPPVSAQADDELLLDDPLPCPGPESRVVRLFDPAAMPSAGELKARIDRHLVECPQTAPPDASRALYDALSELRRSLR